MFKNLVDFEKLKKIDNFWKTEKSEQFLKKINFLTILENI